MRWSPHRSGHCRVSVNIVSREVAYGASRDIAMRGVSRWGWLMAPLLLTLGACAEPTNHFHAAPSVSQLAPDRSSGDGRRLEVTHQFTLRVPNAETEGIQQKHIAECIKLGCAIVSTSIDRSN